MKRLMLIILLMATVSPAMAQDDSTPNVSFHVPKDANLPVDELSLLLSPLTRADLAEEVVLWRELLQNKLHTISEVQITMKYVNRDIQVSDGTHKNLAAFLSASRAFEKAQASAEGDTTEAGENERRDLEKKTLEARFSLKDAVVLALAREETAFQSHNLNLIVNRAMKSLKAQGKSEPFEEFVHVELGLANLVAEIDASEEGFQPGDEEKMAALEAAIEEISRKKTGVKNLIVEYLANLMRERDELVKRIRMVISVWETKGATLEDLANIENFINDVTSFKLDVADQATRLSLVTLWVKSEAGGIKLARSIGRFLGMLTAFWLLAMLVGTITSKGLSRAEHVSQLMKEFIIRSIRRVIFLLGFIMSLSIAGVNVAPILGVVGAAGFVIAFALQSTLGNFASGIMIMMYKPFDVGDSIDASGVMGVVKTMNLTSTIINTFDNKLVIVPNNSIWGGVITNITGSDTRRVDLVFRISYGDDSQLAEKIILEVLSEQQLILEDPEPNVRMHELSDFTVNFICRPWVKTSDYWTVRWEMTRKIRERFEAAGFSAPVDPGAFVKRLGGPKA